jgi:vesicle-fusing ATPase
MMSRDNLFGRSPRPGRDPAPPQYGGPSDTPMGGYDDPRGSYGSGSKAPPGYGGVPTRTAVGRNLPPPQSISRQLRPAKVDNKNLADQYIYGNM